MTNLVTGFDAFHGADYNPSGAVAQRVTGVTSVVLPTSYVRAETEIRDLLYKHRPNWAVFLGLNAMASKPMLERFALNIDDSENPDNDGEARRGVPIAPLGPDALKTHLDLKGIQQHLAGHGYDVGISNHAGAFVCNHTYYIALSAAPSTTRCVFIHIPSVAHDDETALGHLAKMVELVIQF